MLLKLLPHRLCVAAGFALVAMLPALLFAAPLPGQIIVNPSNSAWLSYADGGIHFTAGPGDPEGFLYRGAIQSDGTRDGDQLDLINKLQATGANSIYMQVVRSHGGDGESNHNPFINHVPENGLNDAVLAQWHEWFAAMDAAGIVIYLFFYDDSTLVWNTGDTVEATEQAFIARIVNEFKQYKHLVWVVAEEYAERLSPSKVEAIAAIIDENDEYEHVISVHKNDGLDFSEFASSSYIDQFAIQYNSVSIADIYTGMSDSFTTAARRYNLNLSESAEWGTGSEARQKAWASAMGGAYVMVLGMDIASTPVSELEDLGALRQFMETHLVADMTPMTELAADATRYVLAEPGQHYIAYTAERGSASMGVDLLVVGATYTLHWLDIESGATETQVGQLAESQSTSWSAPDGFGDEVALSIVFESSEAIVPPSKPTGVAAEVETE